MSLFIGKDNSSDNIMHITKDETSLAGMKNGSISSTIFHSDFEYLIHCEYEALDYQFKPAYDVDYNSGYPSATIIDFGEEFADKVADGHTFLIEVGSEIYFQIAGDWRLHDQVDLEREIYPTEWYASVSDGQNSSRSFTPTDTKKCVLIWYTSSSDTQFKAYVLNLNTTTAELIYPSFTSDEVVVNSNELTVRGIDLPNLRYVSTEVINGVDLERSTHNLNLQFINSVPSSGSITLQSEAEGNTKVKKGTKTIFTTEFGINKLRLDGVEYNNFTNYRVYGDQTRLAEIGSGLSTGDIILVGCTEELNAGQDYLYYPVLFKYQENYSVMVYKDTSKANSERYWWFTTFNGKVYLKIQFTHTLGSNTYIAWHSIRTAAFKFK